MTSQFVGMTSLLIFFDVVMFLLSGLVTGLRNVSNKMLLNAAKCQGYSLNAPSRLNIIDITLHNMEKVNVNYS